MKPNKSLTYSKEGELCNIAKYPNAAVIGIT